MDYDWFPEAAGDECAEAVKALEEANQQHLWKNWKKGERDADKRRFLLQVHEAHKSYPGGLKKYYENAVHLLEESKLGKNPLAGYTPEVPAGVDMYRTCDAYDQMTQRGLEAIPSCAFVLVAGGLGERLGYPGIKLSLPVETVTHTCFLELYIQYILAWQAESKAGGPVPLAIMTSGDTHAATEQLLEANGNFGMAPGQVTLMKQGKVPALSGNDAAFATDGDGFNLVTKPHGHGDVHQLLYSTGLTEKWKSQGKTHVCFMQDTHALVVLKVLSLIGVAVERGLGMNSMSIPRKPGEATGSICKLTKPGAPPLTMNVEYNQLDPLLNESLGRGDEPGASGFSPFPGNVNTFVLDLAMYHSVLEASGGVVPEFVNPKYTDTTRCVFKSPTRLECMMQDIPKFFPATAAVGFTCFERESYCPVKNATADGVKKQASGQNPSCAAAGEDAWLSTEAQLLRECGVAVAGDPAEAARETWLGIRVPRAARACLSADFAPTRGLLRGKIGEGVTMTASSLLVVRGRGVTLSHVDLDGTLVINAVPGATVAVRNLVVRNKGWHRVAVPDTDATPAALRIRGYTHSTSPDDAVILTFDTPGEYVCDQIPQSQL